MSKTAHAELFRGKQFPDTVILVCVWYYLRFSLSLREVRDLMREREVKVNHSTIWRWIQQYAPELHRRLKSKLRCTGQAWRVDETHVRVGGCWTYLYRAVDSEGQTIDFLLSRQRDAAAARLFFRQALADLRHLPPREIVSDGNPSYPAILKQLKRERRIRLRCRFRCSRYLNNRIEQDHRAIKRRIEAKQWFRSWAGAQHAIAGYEAIHMIRKGQVDWVQKGDITAQAALFYSLLLHPTGA